MRTSQKIWQSLTLSPDVLLLAALPSLLSWESPEPEVRISCGKATVRERSLHDA